MNISNLKQHEGFEIIRVPLNPSNNFKNKKITRFLLFAYVQIHMEKSSSNFCQTAIREDSSVFFKNPSL